MNLNKMVGAFASMALALGLALPQNAVADPDISNMVVVPQLDGAFTATKQVDIYFDNNPMDPFPGDGETTYVYTITNDAVSFFEINSFLVNLTAVCPIGSIGFLATGQNPDAPGGEVLPPGDPNGQATWTFNPNNGLAPGAVSSGLYITSSCAPGGTADTIVSLGGELGFDAQGPCLGPMVPGAGECEMQIEKFCSTEEDPGSVGNDCQGDVEKLVFEYTGDGCNTSTNTQGGNFECVGDPGHAQPVRVKEFLSNVSIAPDGEVLDIGDRVRLRAKNGHVLPDSTPLWVKKGGQFLQDLVIDTSCDQPLNVGDKFGSLTLVKIVSTEGGTVSASTYGSGHGSGHHGSCHHDDEDNNTDPNSDEPTNACSVKAAPLGTECNQRPETITFRYVGGTCAETTNDQNGTLYCSGDPGTTSPVKVVMTDGNGNEFLNTGSPANVSLGDTLEASAANAGLSQFSSNSWVKVYDAAGTQIQQLDLHTSCSKPLAIGDRFGSIQIVSFDDVTAGGEVWYTYKVTNPNPDPVTNVTVTDDKIADVVCPMDTLASGEMMVCTAHQFITQDTMNLATVSANSGSTVCTEAVAGANVTIDDIDVGKKKKSKHKKKSKKKTKKKVQKKQHKARHGW